MAAATGNAAAAVIVDPPALIVFPGDHPGVTAVVRITNPSKMSIYFKFKTTAPRNYSVRPNSGILSAKETIDVTLQLQQPIDAPVSSTTASAPDAANDASLRNRAKFLLMTAVARDESVSAASFWAQLPRTSTSAGAGTGGGSAAAAAAAEIHEHKLRCRHDLGASHESESTVLSSSSSNSSSSTDATANTSTTTTNTNNTTTRVSSDNTSFPNNKPEGTFSSVISANSPSPPPPIPSLGPVSVSVSAAAAAIQKSGAIGSDAQSGTPFEDAPATGSASNPLRASTMTKSSAIITPALERSALLAEIVSLREELARMQQDCAATKMGASSSSSSSSSLIEKTIVNPRHYSPGTVAVIAVVAFLVGLLLY